MESVKSMSECPKKFLGKYRGLVIDNIDPEMRGRILVQVPDISTFFPSTWALPCLPVGGMQAGLFAVPPIGAGVWIEFEQGDLSYPIWTGCFFGTAAEVPALSKTAPLGVPSITLQTPLQNGIVINDMLGPTGGIKLMSSTGATIIVNDTGIYINNGKGASIEMIGTSVFINKDALVILK